MAHKVKAAMVVALALIALLASGCGPEATRARGGGPGADVGNRVLGPEVEIHGRTDPSYETPLRGLAIEVTEE